jgi:hypothetical protein
MLPTLVKSTLVFILSCTVLVIFNQSKYGNCYEGHCVNAAISNVWFTALIISVGYGIYKHANRHEGVSNKKNETNPKIKKQVSLKKTSDSNSVINTSEHIETNNLNKREDLDVRPSLVVKNRLNTLRTLRASLPENLSQHDVYPLLEHSAATLEYLNQGYSPLTIKMLEELSYRLDILFSDEHEVLLCHLELGWGKLIKVSGEYITVEFNGEIMKMQNVFGGFLVFGLVHPSNQDIYIVKKGEMNKQPEWQVPSYHHR